MKLEQLAGMLKKPVKELEDSLNLTNQDEVSDKIIETEINNHIKEIAISNLSEGKKQAEGMARKKVLQEAEAKLKSRFELEDGNFDEMIESLSSKVGRVEKVTDEKIVKERDAWKAKAEKLDSDFQAKLKELERIETNNFIKRKIEPILEKYDFATPKVKEIAVNQFLEGKNFIISGEDVFLEIDGKPQANFSKVTESHFLDYGSIKGVQKQQNPTRPQQEGFSYGNSLPELAKAMREAKTVDEKNAILEKMKSLETA